MKPFDDKDLIAYHLGELSPRRARALERALQRSPSLAAESEAFAATLRAFKGGEQLRVGEEELARNWRALLPSLVAYKRGPVMRSRWRLPALAGAGVALASTLVFIGTHHHHATTFPRTSSMRQPGDTVRSNPLSESSSIATAPTMENRGPIQEWRKTVASSHPPLPGGAGDSSHRRISYLSLATEPAAVPNLIPLASLSLPAPPAPPLPDSDMEAAAPVQTGARSSRWKSQRWRISVHHEHPADLTLAMGGTLVGTRQASNSGTVERSQGATHAVSAIAAWHQQMRPAVGYRITVSYTRPEFQYNSKAPGTTGSTVTINSRVYELAGTYVVQGPHHGALSTSAEAGAGLMGFLPTMASTDTSYNLRGAAVVGVAAEVAVTKHLAVHAAYRGQIFKGPDFKYTGVAAPVSTSTLFSNEPTVGITYRFSHK